MIDVFMPNPKKFSIFKYWHIIHSIFLAFKTIHTFKTCDNNPFIARLLDLTNIPFRCITLTHQTGMYKYINEHLYERPASLSLSDSRTHTHTHIQSLFQPISLSFFLLNRSFQHWCAWKSFNANECKHFNTKYNRICISINSSELCTLYEYTMEKLKTFVETSKTLNGLCNVYSRTHTKRCLIIKRNMPWIHTIIYNNFFPQYRTFCFVNSKLYFVIANIINEFYKYGFMSWKIIAM